MKKNLGKFANDDQLGIYLKDKNKLLHDLVETFETVKNEDIKKSFISLTVNFGINLTRMSHPRSVLEYICSSFNDPILKKRLEKFVIDFKIYHPSMYFPNMSLEKFFLFNVGCLYEQEFRRKIYYDQIAPDVYANISKVADSKKFRFSDFHNFAVEKCDFVIKGNDPSKFLSTHKEFLDLLQNFSREAESVYRVQRRIQFLTNQRSLGELRDIFKNTLKLSSTKHFLLLEVTIAALQSKFHLKSFEESKENLNFWADEEIVDSLFTDANIFLRDAPIIYEDGLVKLPYEPNIFVIDAIPGKIPNDSGTLESTDIDRKPDSWKVPLIITSIVCFFILLILSVTFLILRGKTK